MPFRSSRRMWIQWAFVALCGCVPASNCAPQAHDFSQVVVVAHRGGSSLAPENTLAAYRKAIELGVDAAECDVRETADGEIVLMHDQDVDRTTNGSGDVKATTLTELRKLDAGGWLGEAFTGERIPTLAEVVDLTRGRLRLFIEIKAGRQILEGIAAVLGERAQEVVIASFNARRVGRAKQVMPAVSTMILLEAPDHNAQFGARVVRIAKSVDADLLGLQSQGIGRPVVELAHDEGLKVFAWTVNDPKEARRLALLGVDGIITDDPPAITAALGGS